MCSSHHLGSRWRSQGPRHRCPAPPLHQCCWWSHCEPSPSTPGSPAPPDSCKARFDHITAAGNTRPEARKQPDVIYQTFRPPSKPPVARCLCWRDAAPNVPHLIGWAFSIWKKAHKTQCGQSSITARIHVYMICVRAVYRNTPTHACVLFREICVTLYRISINTCM